MFIEGDIIYNQFIIQGYPVYLRDADFNIVTDIVETVGPWKYMNLSLYENSNLKWQYDSTKDYKCLLTLNINYQQLKNSYEDALQDYKYKYDGLKLYKIPKNNTVTIKLLAPKEIIVWHYYLLSVLCTDVSLVILHFYLSLIRKDLTLYKKHL